jgi:hypothetical protein
MGRSPQILKEVWDMSNEMMVIELGNNWYVNTPAGRIGPMESRQEADAYIRLMSKVIAAGSETACTEAECVL